MENFKLSIVIPVYNEEKTVNNTINDIKRELKNTNFEYEIIAINDCSTDKSLEILKKIENIIILNHSQNKGYGSSLKTGIKKSQHDWIVIIDADGTYPAKAIPELIKNTPNYDMVVGSRDKKENIIPSERIFAKKFLNTFASYLTGKKIPDLNSGLRIFKKNLIFKYWSLFPERFSFSSTTTMLCATYGYNMKFISIDYYKRKGKSSIKPTDFFKFLKLITKISLFFNPIKVFAPLAIFILLIASIFPLLFFMGLTKEFFDTTFIVLSTTALQTLFFGLLAEIIIHNK